MANKKLNDKQKNVKNNIDNKEMSGEAKQLIIISIAVILFLGLFYLLTVVITGDGFDSKKKDDKEEVQIQHKEILVGTSFSVKDPEYYVLYYKTDDEDVSSDLATLVSTYRSSDKETYLYTVDMSNGLNVSFNSKESNKSAGSASELKIAGPTLIKFVDGKINEYIEGVDKITEVLE